MNQTLAISEKNNCKKGKQKSLTRHELVVPGQDDFAHSTRRARWSLPIVVREHDEILEDHVLLA